MKKPATLSALSGRYQWVALAGFALVHVACLAAIWTGVTWRAVIIGFVLYWSRMFAVTGGLHRYFGHRTYSAPRWFMVVLAIGGASAFHGGPLSWTSRHRWHHAHSDEPGDFHSPVQHSFWYSQWGWIFDPANVGYDQAGSKDFNHYPELRWLEKWHWVVPAALSVVCYLLAGASGLVVGMGWSTVAMLNASLSINSLTHIKLPGSTRRYATPDNSQNHWLLALLTMGEGWHNNHHHYPNTVKQGFLWWEYDFSYYILRALALVGVISKLRLPPPHKIASS